MPHTLLDPFAYITQIYLLGPVDYVKPNLFYFCREKCLWVRMIHLSIVFEIPSKWHASFRLEYIKTIIHCIRTIELRNDIQMKTIVNFGCRVISTFLLQKMNFHFLIFPRYWKPLAIGRPWNAKWIQRSAILSAHCLINISGIVTQVDKYVNGTLIFLHDVDWIFVLKCYLKILNSMWLPWRLVLLYTHR